VSASLEPLHLVWFAGGGGSSCGAKMHLGRDVDYALNHDAVALRMHEVNHPGTIHMCADVFAAQPEELEPERAIGTMWFSPDCTHHSKARGSAPKSERIRGLAWCVIPWARKRRPSVIFIENVEEFRDWGPLFPDGHPDAGQADPARKGETFAAFNAELADCGYEGEWRELVVADYGGETTRKRLFGVFRCDGLPIVWPARTHAPRDKAAELGLEPWVPAASFIDFSRPCPSIFMSQEEAKARGLNIKRPLVAATRRRIAKGVERYVIAAAEPFIVPITHRGDDGVHCIGDPLKTVTASRRGEFALAAPYMTKFRRGSAGASLEEPAPTVTANHFVKRPGGAVPLGVVAPLLVGTAFGDDRPRAGLRAWSVEGPARTVTGSPNEAVASVYLGRQFGSTVSGRDLAEPHPSVMSDGGGGKSQVIAATLDRAFGKTAPADIAEPLNGVTGRPHDGLIAACLTTYYATGVAPTSASPSGP
jgi:DNA (cytosine-5)-methyltransferase 1